MKTFKETDLENFKAWSGAVDTQKAIIRAGKAKVDEFDAMIEELYPDGLSETALNDLLWFEDEWLFETLGISEDDSLP
ncbi:MAG: hypothetical protein KGY51_11985, partial [Psychroflexus sp.]|nr:hypothetical protein [Psychroflexus sp.]